MIDGVVADPANWPATIIFASRTFDGRSYHCTGTIVGPRVVLTAAHCLKSTASVTIGGRNYRLDCTPHEKFVPVESGPPSAWYFDWALCSSKLEFQVPFYEVARASEDYWQAYRTAVTQVKILGFGCTNNGRASNLLSIGDSVITEHPVPTDTSREEVSTLMRVTAGATSCKGDSGGALYHIDRRNGRRAIVATVAAGPENNSYTFAPSTWTHWFQGFATQWTGRRGNEYKICGVHSDVHERCRLAPEL
ncbi:trypsin-like serine protease [Roseibium album]|uniref:trypsin-like serine protease n=1 Tax=Roseibium album TaxID=311410 RepID=UPI00391AF440